MSTFDSCIVRAANLRPGHYLIGVDEQGEHLHRVVTVRDEAGYVRGRVVLVVMEGGRRERLGRNERVRVADPSAAADAQRVNG